MLNQKIEKALKIIKKLDFSNLKCGKYVVDDDFYYLVQEYETKMPEEVRHEAHRKYVDIQYIVEGTERMNVTASAFMKVDELYNEEKDIVFFKEPLKASTIILSEGQYAIFYPKDSHKPGICVDRPVRVKKIVGKVRISFVP